MMATCFSVASLFLFMFFCVMACGEPSHHVAIVLPANKVYVFPVDTMIATGETIQTNLVASWSSFANFDGKYAMEANLFEREPLKTRINILLQKARKIFLQRFKVSIPIEIENKVLYNEGHMPGKSGFDEATIAVDMDHDIIYLGITINKALHVYSEKEAVNYPEKFLHWMQKFTP